MKNVKLLLAVWCYSRNVNYQNFCSCFQNVFLVQSSSLLLAFLFSWYDFIFFGVLILIRLITSELWFILVKKCYPRLIIYNKIHYQIFSTLLLLMVRFILLIQFCFISYLRIFYLGLACPKIDCDARTHTYQQMLSYSRVLHWGDVGFNVNCFECEKQFRTETPRKNHLRHHHICFFSNEAAAVPPELEALRPQSADLDDQFDSSQASSSCSLIGDDVPRISNN